MIPVVDPACTGTRVRASFSKSRLVGAEVPRALKATPEERDDIVKEIRRLLTEGPPRTSVILPVAQEKWPEAGVTAEHVRVEAYNLGVELQTGAIKGTTRVGKGGRPKGSKDRGPRKPRPSNVEDIASLKREDSTLNASQIAKRLKLSRQVVSRHLKRLGLA